MNNIEDFNTLIDKAKDKSFNEVFEELESLMMEISRDKVRNSMKQHLNEMKASIANGLGSDEVSESGMSGMDSRKIFKRYHHEEETLFNGFLGKILCYALAVMEENLRMGKIVACPTAGSCGIVPAVLIAVAEEKNISDEVLVDALFTAGGIGKLINQKVALAGAVAGCQAECGTASAMAAGALVQVLGGSKEQILNASALALKNLLGLACDPVAGLVEVPCIKRNAFLAVHAVSAAELSLAGIESAIPLDDVVSAMKQIGDLMSPLIKETSEAGLATTKTGLEITARLEAKWHK